MAHNGNSRCTNPRREAGAFVKEITIRLHRHHNENDWSVEIDGAIFRHVSDATSLELVEYAIVAAEHDLLGNADRSNYIAQAAQVPN